MKTKLALILAAKISAWAQICGPFHSDYTIGAVTSDVTVITAENSLGKCMTSAGIVPCAGQETPENLRAKADRLEKQIKADKECDSREDEVRRALDSYMRNK